MQQASKHYQSQIKQIFTMWFFSLRSNNQVSVTNAAPTEVTADDIQIAIKPHANAHLDHQPAGYSIWIKTIKLRYNGLDKKTQQIIYSRDFNIRPEMKTEHVQETAI